MPRLQSLRKSQDSINGWIGIACVCLVVALLGSLSVKGQSITGTVSGQVTDPSRAVVSGATVTVTDQSTGVAEKAITSTSGEYVVPLLPIGTYTVAASKQGFRTSSSQDIRVTAGSNVRVELRLEIGASNEKVEVRGVAPLLQTASAEVSNAVEGRAIRELPVVGRDLLRLATLGPGVVERVGSNISFLTNSYLGSNIPTVAGGRGEGGSFTLGGINANSRQLNFPVEKPSLDAVEEFTVLANNYTAEYGQGDGQYIVEFRSGTNKLHGSVYEFLRNDALNARSFFDGKKPFLRYNQFGAAVGGPIIKDRTFFFSNYEGTRNPSPTGTEGGLFPTASLLQGDFSNFRNAAGNVIPIYDPATTDPVTGARQQFPGNIIPAGRISSIASRLYALYGAPTPASIPPGASNNVLVAVPHAFTIDQLSFKIDHHFAGGDTLSTRYSFTDPRSFSGSITSASQSTGDGRNQILGQTWTHIFRPNLVNEVRGGYVRQRSVSFPRLAADKDLQKEAGIPNPLPFNFIPTIFFQGSTGTPGFNQLNGIAAGGGGQVQQSYQVIDNLSWIRGKHAFKFGTDLRRRRWDTVGVVPSGGGSLQYYGQYTSALQPDPRVPGNFVPVMGTGSPLADFLLGQTAAINFSVGQNQFSYRDTEASWFVQDTWRVSPKLTVMLGVRWDYQGPITEKHGKESWFISDSRCPNGCTVNDGTFGGTFDPIFNPFPGQRAIRPGGFSPELDNLGPRISLAYRVHGNTVIRAGYGIFYSNWGQNNFPGATNPPFGLGTLQFTSVNNGSDSLARDTSAAFPLSTTYPIALAGTPPPTVPGTVGLGFYYDTHMVQPSLNNASFAIQHAFTPTLSAEIGYLGKFGRHLTGFNSINPCTTTPCTKDSRGINIRRFTNFGSVTIIQTDNESAYNGGYIKVQKRFSQGLSFLGSWTYSRDIAIGGDSEGNDIFLGSSGGSFDYRNRLKHLSVLDVTHRVAISGIYELPVGHGKKFLGSVPRRLDHLVGGWQVGWITAFQSGAAVDLTSFGQNCYKPGQSRPLARMDFRKTGFYFDTSRFEGCGIPGAEQIPYTNFRGAGINNWDVSILKNFRIAETHRLQLRSEFFNIWNHGQFEVPGHVSFVPGFGQFQARNPSFLEFGAEPGRTIELGLKYDF